MYSHIYKNIYIYIYIYIIIIIRRTPKVHGHNSQISKYMRWQLAHKATKYGGRKATRDRSYVVKKI